MKPPRMLPAEPVQTDYRELTIEREVPADAFYYAFKMSERKSQEYYVTDLISDALGREKSSRLYVSLKKERQLVSEISCYVMGSTDQGLLIISGKLNEGITFEQLDLALWETLDELISNEMTAEEFHRLQIKIQTSREFQDQGLLNRAMQLCHFELLGDANGVNEEAMLYSAIQPFHIREVAADVLRRTNCSLLKVKALKKYKVEVSKNINRKEHHA